MESLLVCCLHVGPGSEAYSQLQAAWHLFYPRIGQQSNCLSFNMKGVGDQQFFPPLALVIPVFSQCCGHSFGSGDSDLGKPNIPTKKKKEDFIFERAVPMSSLEYHTEASSVPLSCKV